MRYREDKQSGNSLSVLGFGGMRLPWDKEKAERLIAKAVENGVNYIDTAYVYPGNEVAVGRILENTGLRDKVFLATKLPHSSCRSHADFDHIFEEQKQRLRTDYIDYYLMHNLIDLSQWERLEGLGIADWIAAKTARGEIRRIGFSFHGQVGEFKKIVDAFDWEFCQIQYNYSDENYQAGVTGLRKAAEKMPVMIMEPLLGGKLVGGLPAEAVQIFKRADPRLSPAAWGLNWVWNQSEVTLLLSGMGDMAQLEENLKLADAAQPGMVGEGEAYRQVLELVNRAYKIRCTGCNYCMPCPRGVNIPGCFSTYNTSYAIGYVEGMKQFVSSTGLTTERSASPSLCVKCGKCETHCPQHIEIIKSLGQVRRRMEPLWLKGVGVVARAFLGKRRKGTPAVQGTHG